MGCDLSLLTSFRGDIYIYIYGILSPHVNATLWIDWIWTRRYLPIPADMAASEPVNLAENLKALRVTDPSADAYQVKVRVSQCVNNTFNPVI